MTVLLVIAAFILGCIFWASTSRENDCPLAELGYNCKGDACDHRKSELYRAKATMAKNQEEYEERNFWKGDRDE